MSGRAQAAMLADGRRLHLQHGPIDIIAEARGAEDEVAAAYRQATARFQSILEELVEELPRLRDAVGPALPLMRGPVARRMSAAVWPHRAQFITPMAAVAGAVADETLAAMVKGRTVECAYANNGGDIALHLASGQTLSAGVVENQDIPAMDARVALTHEMPVRGLATSGWRGRSHSFGIADAVTVLAKNAATADAAATLIANDVNVDHPAIERAPARSLTDESDLAVRLVTVAVGDLPKPAIERALQNGIATAEGMRARGLIVSAYLSLQRHVRVVCEPCALSRAVS